MRKDHAHFAAQFAPYADIEHRLVSFFNSPAYLLQKSRFKPTVAVENASGLERLVHPSRGVDDDQSIEINTVADFLRELAFWPLARDAASGSFWKDQAWPAAQAGNLKEDAMPSGTIRRRYPDMPGSEKRIQPLSALNSSGLLELNNNHAEETSWLSDNRFRHLLQKACYARGIVPGEAMLLAFDRKAEYDSPNFLWFRERYSNFVYIDRIIVSQGARRQGLAAALYRDLFRWAASQRYDRIVCEVNQIPPNPASNLFHEKMGFTPVGEGEPHAGKYVRYLSRLV
jgi:predicted GNAT superfamily acetyltransferase